MEPIDLNNDDYAPMMEMLRKTLSGISYSDRGLLNQKIETSSLKGEWSQNINATLDDLKTNGIQNAQDFKQLLELMEVASIVIHMDALGMSGVTRTVDGEQQYGVMKDGKAARLDDPTLEGVEALLQEKFTQKYEVISAGAEKVVDQMKEKGMINDEAAMEISSLIGYDPELGISSLDPNDFDGGANFLSTVYENIISKGQGTITGKISGLNSPEGEDYDVEKAIGVLDAFQETSGDMTGKPRNPEQQKNNDFNPSGR